MKVKVCKLNEIKLLAREGKLIVGKETIEPVLPTYGTEGDACMDVYPIYLEVDNVKDRFIYHTGLAFAIGDAVVSEEKKVPNEMELRPRSNLTKSDWYIPNSPGTLDYGYRGELLIIFKNRTDFKIVQLFEILIKNTVLPPNENYGAKKLLTDLRSSIALPPYKCDGEDRCCQLLIRGSERIEWDEVSFDELGTTERGEGGFGHTGGGVK